jgi:HupE / UreJ protein
MRRIVALLAGGLLYATARAHEVAAHDARFLGSIDGVALGPYAYLGAKHMVTGVDHLLFLAGVIFFLYRMRDIALYVTLFAVGHSATLLLGVLGGWRIDPYAVDAIIGASVAYKAFENLGGFRHLGWRLDSRAAVLLFGLAHGLGLATKLQDAGLSEHGMTANLIAFNVGVEFGQVAALTILLLVLNMWRNHGSYLRHAWSFNMLLLAAGFTLFGYQLVGLAQ